VESNQNAESTRKSVEFKNQNFAQSHSV